MQYALVVLWLLVFAGLAVLGAPLASRLFGDFESRGVGFALPVALLTMWLPVYFLGHLSFGPLTVVVGLIVLLVVAAVLALDREALRNRELRVADSVRVDRSAALDVAVVFVAAFAFLVAIRAADPAVHALGGEKYLDYGILKSLMRSPTLPPEDMWFAGEPVRYYYGGHLVAAILTTLTGTAPKFAYNLALAGFYAMLVTGAYDLAGNVAAARGGSRRVAGVFAAFFVGFASNLATMGRLVLGFLPAGMRTSLVGQDANVPYYSLTRGTEYYIQDTFSYWTASRVITTNSYTINEFPLFAWLNGDLHAHMMGTPFLLLGAAIGFALYLAPATATRRRLGLLAVLPLLGAFQLITDTWSFPSIFGITYLALVFSPAAPATLLSDGGQSRFGSVGSRFGWLTDDRSRFGSELRRLLLPLVVVAVLGLVTVLLGLPFLLGAGASRSVDILPVDARSTLGELFVVHGAFLLLFGVYLFDRAGEERRWPLAVGALVVAVVAMALSIDVLVVTLPLLVVGWALLRFERPVGYETVLVVAGAGLVTLVEFVYVVEQAGPLRMNTVFKTYMQVWVFWGTAAGAIVAGLLHRPHVTRRAADARRSLGSVSLPAMHTVVSVLLSLVVLSTSVYGAFALTSHFEHGGPSTLDATSFGPGYDDAEVEATAWLDDQATSETTIASAPAASWYPAKRTNDNAPGMYDWRSSIASSLTGVPTVAGWAHEVGYRGSQDYYNRVAEVDTLYTGSAAESNAVVEKYDVEYVWVGSAERARYGTELADFGSRPGYEVAFQNDAVTIYRVEQSGDSA
jgi:YYY domain-containing protein